MQHTSSASSYGFNKTQPQRKRKTFFIHQKIVIDVHRDYIVWLRRVLMCEYFFPKKYESTDECSVIKNEKEQQKGTHISSYDLRRFSPNLTASSLSLSWSTITTRGRKVQCLLVVLKEAFIVSIA